MRKYSSELLVARFIKSATNGRTVSIRTRRVFTLILVPIWLLGLAWSAPFFYDGCKSIIEYFEIRRNSRIPYEYLSEGTRKVMIRDAIRSESSIADTLDYTTWEIIEGREQTPQWVIDKINRMSYRQDELDEAKSRMLGMLSLPFYIGVFFVMPWVILRLIFWIVDADKGNEMS